MPTNNEVRVIQDLSHLKLQVYQGVTDKESFRHVFFDMPKVCKKSEFGLLMNMILILSFLESFYRDASLKIGFLLYVLGPSNSFKTTLTHYFTKFLDRLNFQSVLASLKADTAATLDYKMSLFPNFPLVIDDYFPGIDLSESNSMGQKLSLVIRKSGERMTSGRMTGNMKMQTQLPARGVYIITAEDRIPGESNLARMLTVEIEQGDIEWDTFNANLEKILMLPTFIYYFRSYIASIGSILPQKLSSSFKQLRTHYTDKYDVSYARMSEVYAYMLSSLRIVLNYGISIQAIDRNQAECIFNEAEEVIISAIEKQLSAISAYSPINMFCKILSEGIILNRLKLIKINEEITNSIDGWEDEKCYYFTENRLYTFIQQEYRSQKINFPLSKEELFKRLSSDKLEIIKSEKFKRNGILANRYDVKKSIKKDYRPRLIWVYKDKLDLFKEDNMH